MQTTPTLAPKRPPRVRRVPPNGQAPVRNRHPAAALGATLVRNERVRAPVLIDVAVGGRKPVVAVVHLDLAALPRQRPVAAVDRLAVDVARAVQPVVGRRRHRRREAAAGVRVARVGQRAARAVHDRVREVVDRREGVGVDGHRGAVGGGGVAVREGVGGVASAAPGAEVDHGHGGLGQPQAGEQGEGEEV